MSCAAGWVHHLRSGGTVAWGDFVAGSADRGGPEGRLEDRPGDRLSAVPGAIQLEVARRLNLVAGPAGAPPALVDRVLEVSPPGRGQPDLALAGAGAPTRFGPPPVDPADVDETELLRVAVGVLAETLLAETPQPARLRRPPLPVPWLRRRHLVGAPSARTRVRTALDRAGVRQGTRAPVTVLLADDLAGMLADLWSWRVRQGVVAGWRWWIRHWAERDQLPPRIDLPAVARTWAARVGAENVHVLVGPDHWPDVAPLVGSRRHLGPIPAEPPSAVATELVRHLNGVLAVLADPTEHQRVLDTALPDPLTAPGPRLELPARHREWATRHAERCADELRVGGYAVHGDVEGLLPVTEGARTPSVSAVLDLALQSLLTSKEGV